MFFRWGSDMVYFIPSALGFIPAAWKDDGTYSVERWPIDAVLLSDDEREAFWKQSPPPGKTLGVNDGRPAWVGHDEVVGAGEIATRERGWRDGVVSSTEWLVNRHRDEQDMQLTTTLQAGQFAELLQYRQTLRDWPQSDLFPGIEHRPLPPAWLADMTP